MAPAAEVGGAEWKRHGEGAGGAAPIGGRRRVHSARKCWVGLDGVAIEELWGERDCGGEGGSAGCLICMAL